MPTPKFFGGNPMTLPASMFTQTITGEYPEEEEAFTEGVTDSGLVFHAARSHYTDLLKGGIKIYERRDALLHAKTAVIDGVWSTIGSTNLDWRSFLHNYELNAVVVGDDFGRQMEAMFQRDEADSELITLEKWKRRSLLDRIKETGSRLWAYWL